MHACANCVLTSNQDNVNASCFRLVVTCSFWLMPWSQFTKGAFPGSSRAVFGRFLAVPHGTRRDPERVPSIFFTLARNIPRLKPVNYPVGARRDPCRNPRGTRGQFLKVSTHDTRSGPLRDSKGARAGACGVLTWLVGNPGDVSPVPLRRPSGSRSGPL